MLNRLREYWLFVVILVFGFFIWLHIFEAALTDYLSTNIWRTRFVWLGNGEFQLFGYTLNFQFEGYSDYSFFYVHWGNNMLNGILPYCDEFGHIELDGVVNDNGLYIFPPLYALLYAAGIALGYEGYWGIGLLLAIFGYLTVFPTYGIAKHLSKNRHIGEAAALTYLLNPSVLYHIDFTWLNPSPFIFFFFTGFYFLIRGHRYFATLLIVTSALFKQMAWFLGVPLIVYLLIRPMRNQIPTESKDGSRVKHGSLSRTMLEHALYGLKSLDVVGFLIGALIALIYAGIIVGPFLILQPNTLFFMSLAAGGFPLTSYTNLPGYGEPIRLQVLPVAMGMPDLAALLDLLVYSRFLLVFGVVTFVGLMFIEPRDEDHPRRYARRLLYLTMLMMLWVHLTGPRGVFKYYFTLFAPFFSIFSSVKMVSSRDESITFSFSMLWVPIAMSLLILLPNRNIYLVGVIIIFVGYLFIEMIGEFWFVVTAVGRWAVRRVDKRLMPFFSRARFKKPRHISTIALQTDKGDR